MHTASTAFLEALNEAGVSYIFANWGSDHPAIDRGARRGAGAWTADTRRHHLPERDGGAVGGAWLCADDAGAPRR